MKVKSESEVAQLFPTLSDPMVCSLPGSSIHGIFQARVLEWGAIAFSTVNMSKELNKNYKCAHQLSRCHTWLVSHSTLCPFVYVTPEEGRGHVLIYMADCSFNVRSVGAHKSTQLEDQ